MKLQDYIDLTLLDRDLHDKYITARAHPLLPLVIYNYTAKAQYNRHWNEATRKCRGLIVCQKTNEVVGRPFEKFFEISDPLCPGIPKDSAEFLSPHVSEKVDGSLIVLVNYNGMLVCSSRGSFVSDQAILAENLILDHYRKHGGDNPADLIAKNETLLAEIVYPENQIVVNYGNQEYLAFLALVKNETGVEDNTRLTTIAAALGQRIVRRRDVVEGVERDMAVCMAECPGNQEGFVVEWPRKDGPTLRIKYKTEWYKRNHRFKYVYTPKKVVEDLLEGKPLGPLMESCDLNNLPKLTDVVEKFAASVGEQCKDLMWDFAFRPDGDRKKVSEYFKLCKNTHSLFTLLDNNNPLGRLMKNAKEQALRS